MQAQSIALPNSGFQVACQSANGFDDSCESRSTSTGTCSWTLSNMTSPGPAPISGLPDGAYPTVALVSGLPDFAYPTPFVIKNTFIEYPTITTVQQLGSANDFFVERQVQSCPASGIAGSPGCLVPYPQAPTTASDSLLAAINLAHMVGVANISSEASPSFTPPSSVPQNFVDAQQWQLGGHWEACADVSESTHPNYHASGSPYAETQQYCMMLAPAPHSGTWQTAEGHPPQCANAFDSWTMSSPAVEAAGTLQSNWFPVGVPATYADSHQFLAPSHAVSTGMALQENWCAVGGQSGVPGGAFCASMPSVTPNMVSRSTWCGVVGQGTPHAAMHEQFNMSVTSAATAEASQNSVAPLVNAAIETFPPSPMPSKCPALMPCQPPSLDASMWRSAQPPPPPPVEEVDPAILLRSAPRPAPATSEPMLAQVLRLVEALPSRLEQATAVLPPVLGSEDLPSIGSMRHQLAGCRPCAFYHTRGCENAEACSFCHLCGSGEKKRRLRDKRVARRGAKFNAFVSASG